MSQGRPLVSAVLSNFNYAAFLPHALDSVLGQSYEPIETIVVDDGSTDESREVLARYDVRTLYQENGGQAAALNAGVGAARGEIICLLDSDDMWETNKVERVVDVLDRHKRAQCLRHRLSIVDEEGRRLGPAIPAIRRTGPVPRSASLVAERVVTASTSALAMRRSAVPHAFPLDHPRRLRFDADALMVARLGAGVPGWQLDEVLGSYRKHDRQQFARSEDIQRMLERQVEVGRLIAEALGRREPVSNYKLRTILATLAGQPRTGLVLMGLAESLRLAGRPALMARQAAALIFAAATPEQWLRKLQRSSGEKVE